MIKRKFIRILLGVAILINLSFSTMEKPAIFPYEASKNLLEGGVIAIVMEKNGNQEGCTITSSNCGDLVCTIYAKGNLVKTKNIPEESTFWISFYGLKPETYSIVVNSNSGICHTTKTFLID